MLELGTQDRVEKAMTRPIQAGQVLVCVGAVDDVVAVLSSLGIQFGGGSAGNQEVAHCTQASATAMPDSVTPKQTLQPSSCVEHFRLDAYDSELWDESVLHDSAHEMGSSGESTAANVF